MNENLESRIEQYEEAIWVLLHVDDAGKTLEESVGSPVLSDKLLEALAVLVEAAQYSGRLDVLRAQANGSPLEDLPLYKNLSQVVSSNEDYNPRKELVRQLAGLYLSE